MWIGSYSPRKPRKSPKTGGVNFRAAKNRITRRPLIAVIVHRGSTGRVMIFAAVSLPTIAADPVGCRFYL